MKPITLTQGKFAMVDDTDFESVSKHKWYACKNNSGVWYAVGTINSKKITMHRFIMGCYAGDGILIDHEDRDGLNCQRRNMRYATFSQNLANRKIDNFDSGYKGVYTHTQTCNGRKTWVARVWKDSKSIYAGKFPYTEEGKIAAAKARDKKALEVHGEFALLNFPVTAFKQQ